MSECSHKLYSIQFFVQLHHRWTRRRKLCFVLLLLLFLVTSIVEVEQRIRWLRIIELTITYAIWNRWRFFHLVLVEFLISMLLFSVKIFLPKKKIMFFPAKNSLPKHMFSHRNRFFSSGVSIDFDLEKFLNFYEIFLVLISVCLFCDLLVSGDV